MRHTAYFLIEPKSEALEVFPAVAEDLADLLLEPLMVSRCFAGRSVWRTQELELVVKLLFVARMREYSPLSRDEDAIRVLGSSDVSTALFDRWWSIRRLNVDETSEEMESYLAALYHRVVPTGNEVVDDFLSSFSRSEDA